MKALKLYTKISKFQVKINVLSIQIKMSVFNFHVKDDMHFNAKLCLDL